MSLAKISIPPREVIQKIAAPQALQKAPVTTTSTFTEATIKPRTLLPQKVKISFGGSYGTERFFYGQCVWWVAKWRNGLKFGGNAYEFPARAKAAGVKMGDKPIVGAIFVQGTGPYGHAGIVSKVYDNGDFQTSEMNWEGWNVVSSRKLNSSDVKTFIY